MKKLNIRFIAHLSGLLLVVGVSQRLDAMGYKDPIMERIWGGPSKVDRDSFIVYGAPPLKRDLSINAKGIETVGQLKDAIHLKFTGKSRKPGESDVLLFYGNHQFLNDNDPVTKAESSNGKTYDLFKYYPQARFFDEKRPYFKRFYKAKK